MSCDTNSNRIGRSGGVAAGVSAAAGKFNHTVGALLARTPYKIPLAVAGGMLMGPLGVMAVLAGANAREKLKTAGAARETVVDAAASAGQAVTASGLTDTATSARQAAGAVKQKAVDAAASARQTIADAAAGARQATEAVTTPVKNAAAAVSRAAGDAVAAAKGTAADALDGYADKLDRAGDAVAPRLASVAGKVLDVADPVGGAAGTALKIAAFAGSPLARKAGLITNRVSRFTGLVGALAGRISRTDLAGTVVREKRTLLFFKGKEAVNVWKSSLTDLLNRADLLGSHALGKGVYASDGVMFETGGATWHRGTSIVDVPGQGPRTITHLQSLNVPASHYYFDRRLDDEQAVGIVTRQKGFEPEKLPGYVGHVTPTEALCPGWAGAKHAMIKSVLYWGGREGKA